MGEAEIPQRVRVYEADVSKLEDRQLYEKLLGLIPPQRKDAVLWLKRDSARHLSLGASLLLRTALLETGITEKNVEICKNEYGKPYLRDYPQIHFNLSHSGRRALCAIWRKPVGCDIELIRDGGMEKVLRCLTPAEQAQVKDNRDFFRIWTLKESFLKAAGTGLHMPLDSFEVSLNPLSLSCHESVRQRGLRMQTSGYFLQEWTGMESYCRSACAADGVFEDRIRLVDFSVMAGS